MAIIDRDNKVDIRPVKLAQRVDNLWVIDGGLKPGERVVAEGIQKVKQGMTVNPKLYDSKPQSRVEVPSRSEEKPLAKAKTGKR